LRRDTPDEETTDWRAVCGKTARTVRRAGKATTFPDPYHGVVDGSETAKVDITTSIGSCDRPRTRLVLFVSFVALWFN